MVANKNKKATGSREILPVLNEKTDFFIFEAYKTIRTNLMFATQNPGCKRVIITSTEPKEGKSINCCNLGITFSQTDSKVLIIDCDLRKPTMHKFFKLKVVPGLSDVLARMSKVEQVICSTKYPNLQVICAGTIPPNPAELLCSPGMEELLNTLSLKYDYILLDTPPINIIADALALSTMADGVVIVVMQGKTTHPELRHAFSSLEFAKAKVLGIILNGVETGGRYGYSNYEYCKKGE